MTQPDRSLGDAPIMRRALVFGLVCVVVPGAAHAGFDARDCETRDKAIVLRNNPDENRAHIKYMGKDRRPGVLDAPVRIMPDHESNLSDDQDPIVAIPITAERRVSTSHQTMHVRHKDGTTCDGRERWDDRSIQSYVLTGLKGTSLAGRFIDKTVKGLTPQGYVVAELVCRSYGMTSAGGCHADEGDQVTWRATAP